MSCENCKRMCERKHWTFAYGYRPGHLPKQGKRRVHPQAIPICDACVQRIPKREQRAKIGALGRATGRVFSLSPVKKIKDDSIWSPVDVVEDNSRPTIYLNVDMVQRCLRKAAEKLLDGEATKWATTGRRRRRRYVFK